MIKVLIINANTDKTTEYLNSWSKYVFGNSIQNKEIEIKNIEGAEVNKNNIKNIIQDSNPHFIFFIGHGDEKCICGYNNEIIMSIDDMELLKDKVIKVLSCKVGKVFGQESVKNGVRVFIGYKDNFVFYHLKDKHTMEEHVQDGVAKYFLEPAFMPAIDICNKKTIQEAFNNSQKKYIENMNYFYKSTSNNSQLYLSALYHNYSNQVCLGDDNIKLC